MSWRLLRSDSGAPADNMAWDEALLAQAASAGRPVLRLYGWTEPAATFGYFQKFADVARLTTLRPLIRRPTGGGLVPHDADWTYSLTVPPGHEWYALRAIDSYRRMHEWVSAAFRAMGMTVELAGQVRAEGVGQCFVGAEKFDVLIQERKVAGAAQRRTKDGLLIQGSIQPPPGALRAEFEAAFVDAGRGLFSGTEETCVPSAALQRQVLELSRGKYSRPEYNERR